MSARFFRRRKSLSRDISGSAMLDFAFWNRTEFDCPFEIEAIARAPSAGDFVPYGSRRASPLEVSPLSLLLSSSIIIRQSSGRVRMVLSHSCAPPPYLSFPLFARYDRNAAFWRVRFIYSRTKELINGCCKSLFNFAAVETRRP
jgi:hypothetical protein